MPNIDQYQARSGRLIKEDGTVVNEANGINADGSQNVTLTGSNLIQPTFQEGRATQLIQTQNGVTILPNNWSNSSWIDSHIDGTPLTFLGVSANMTSGTGMTVVVAYSHDGVNQFTEDWIFDGVNSIFNTKVDVELPARYFRLNVRNKDATNPKVTNAYAYLKA